MSSDYGSSNLVTVDTSAVTVEKYARPTSTGFTSFVENLNPIGSITKTLAELMACRLELKKLNHQAKRIKSQYDLDNKRVDGGLKIALYELETRRKSVEACFIHAENSLRDQQISTAEVIGAIRDSRKVISDRKISLDEKQCAHETIRELSKTLVGFQKEGSKRLKTLIDTTKTELSSVSTVTAFLPSAK